MGEGQKFGDSAARNAIDAAEADLNALDKALADHLPRLREIAGLARETGVDKAAKAHAAQIRQGMLDLAKGRLALDNAGIFRSARAAKGVSKTVAARTSELAASYAALLNAVGKEVGKSTAASSPKTTRKARTALPRRRVFGRQGQGDLRRGHRPLNMV